MARAHDTMMNPPIEDLLDTVDSKFSLVTLAARRARQINSLLQPARRRPRPHGAAAGQLRRPQAVEHRVRRDRRAQDRARRAPGSRGRGRGRRQRPTPPSPDRYRTHVHARRQAHRARCHRGHRCLQGRRDLSPTGRRRRPRRPRDDQGRRALRGRHHAVGAGQRAGADQPVGRGQPRSRTPRSVNRPTSSWSRRPRLA